MQDTSLVPILSYNTNGFAHHRLLDAIQVLADLGYRHVAITLDIHSLDPADPNLEAHAAAVKDALANHNMTCTIETGGRFVLDPHRKHWPTLISAAARDRQRRINFLRRAVDVARALDADAVSFWSGAIEPGVTVDSAWSHLREGCRALLKHARDRAVQLAFEPEPGMFIETCDQYAKLAGEMVAISGGIPLGLALDVGHVHCLGDGDPASRIRQFAESLRVIHIEDMRTGLHEHLLFGEGEIDFPPILAAMREVGYTGPLVVELSRHGHDAVNAARRALEFLSPMLTG